MALLEYLIGLHKHAATRSASLGHVRATELAFSGDPLHLPLSRKEERNASEVEQRKDTDQSTPCRSVSNTERTVARELGPLVSHT